MHLRLSCGNLGKYNATPQMKLRCLAKLTLVLSYLKRTTFCTSDNSQLSPDKSKVLDRRPRSLEARHRDPAASTCCGSTSERRMAHPVTTLKFEQQTSPRKSQPVNPDISTFEDLLGLHEAASLLGMHWKTLEGMARTRKIPAFKVGKRWRFRVSSLNVWLEHGLNSNATNHVALTGQE
jgi:excisionase family DNA binding protein